MGRLVAEAVPVIHCNGCKVEDDGLAVAENILRYTDVAEHDVSINIAASQPDAVLGYRVVGQTRIAENGLQVVAGNDGRTIIKSPGDARSSSRVWRVRHIVVTVVVNEDRVSIT